MTILSVEIKQKLFNLLVDDNNKNDHWEYCSGCLAILRSGRVRECGLDVCWRIIELNKRLAREAPIDDPPLKWIYEKFCETHPPEFLVNLSYEDMRTPDDQLKFWTKIVRFAQNLENHCIESGSPPRVVDQAEYVSKSVFFVLQSVKDTVKLKNMKGFEH